MSDKSTENYLDNLLDSMNKLQDTDTKMSGADQDEFLKKFEDELENETYDEYLSNFEKELERENEQAKGQALNVQTPAPDDKDASLDDMLTEFDRRMKEQETQGDKQENKADNNLSDAVFNFTPADSGIEMMDANMPEMAENPKQEETPESIITNEPQMVEEIGEPDLAGNASKDILDILGSDGLDNIGDLLEGKTGETGADIDDYASSQMKVHETADAAVDAQDTEKKSLLKRIISFFTKEPQSDDVTDIQSTAEGAETDAKTLSDENKQILEALDADGELNEATDKPKKGKKPKKEKKPKKPKKEKAAKEKKPKKEKKRKEEKEKIPEVPEKKLSLKKVIPIVVVCISLGAVILLLSSFLTEYMTRRSGRKAYYAGDYQTCYQNFFGKELDETEQVMYSKSESILTIRMWLREYEVFVNEGSELEALDSLLQAVHDYPSLLNYATEYNAQDEVTVAFQEILNVLSQKYGLSQEEAQEIADISNNVEYTQRVMTVLQKLGLESWDMPQIVEDATPSNDGEEAAELPDPLPEEKEIQR